MAYLGTEITLKLKKHCKTNSNELVKQKTLSVKIKYLKVISKHIKLDVLRLLI